MKRVTFDRGPNRTLWLASCKGSNNFEYLAMICHHGLKQHVELPWGCRKLDLVFTKQDSGKDCFTITKEGHIRAHRGDIYFSFRWLLSDMRRWGYRFVRVEVDA